MTKAETISQRRQYLKEALMIANNVLRERNRHWTSSNSYINYTEWERHREKIIADILELELLETHDE